MIQYREAIRMRYDTVVFDFDGTVADTAQGIFESVQYAMRKLGLPQASENTLRRFIGPPLPYSFRQFVGLSEDVADQAVLFYRENYGAVGKFKLYFYDGMPELLRSLRGAGVRTCLASAKPDRFIQQILDHYDMHGAKELGVAGLGVLYGYGSAEELLESGADYIVRTPQEIAAIVGVDK